MKKLDLENSKDLLSLKESLNNVIDKEIAKRQLTEKVNGLKNHSFGEYKALFESILDELYDLPSGKKTIGSYVKLVKENKAINTIYKLFESIENINPEDATFNAYALADVCESVDRKALAEGEKKMYSILKEGIKDCKNVTCESIDNALEAHKTLNESISFLTHKSDKGNLKHLNTRADSIKILSESISKNIAKEDEVITEGKTNKELLSDLHTLLENSQQAWEKKVLQDLSLCYFSNSDKSELFESYKNDCITTIDSLSDGDLDKSSRLHAMKQQLQEKKYNEETLTDDLFKLAELKETLIEG